MNTERRTAERRLADRREKRGRRPVFGDPYKLGMWLPTELYDRLAVYAIREHGTNISAAVRALLEAGLIAADKKPRG